MGMLALHRRALTAFGAGLIGILAIGLAASVAGAGKADRLTKVSGTIWAANRGAHTIRGFDAATGSVVSTVAMRDGSQPGDVAYARGRLYVAEEFGTPPAIAIVDPDTGVVEKRIELAPGSRPHHVHLDRPRRPRRLRALWDGQRGGGRYDDGIAARPVGHRSGQHERPRSRRRLLERREDPVRGERRVEPGDRARATDG